MRLGIAVPAKSTDKYCVPADRLIRYVQRAEAYGFKSAWTLEHLTVPKSFKTSFQDPLTTLGTLAGATDRIELGTSILILPMRHPVLVAKRAATLQYFSGNRLTLGVGQGYMEEEYDVVDVPFEERHKRFMEGIELLYRLLNERSVTFDGEFYQTEELQIEPHLNQPPRILAAGGGIERDGEWKVAQTVKRRIDLVGGWIASSSAEIEKDWAEIAPALESNGTNPGTIDRVGLQHVHLEPGEDRDRVIEKQHKVFSEFIGGNRGLEWVDEYFLTGTVDEIRERLRGYESAGFDEVIFHPAAHTADEIDRQLELWNEYIGPEFS